jgi:hypothetical protein
MKTLSLQAKPIPNIKEKLKVVVAQKTTGKLLGWVGFADYLLKNNLWDNSSS